MITRILAIVLLTISAHAGEVVIDLSTGGVSTQPPTPEQVAERESAQPVVQPPPLIVGPYGRYDAALASVWPVLPDHPAATNIPAAGLSYRLGEGTNTTWWIVRQGDLVATQVSAHDAQGRSIIRSRNLRTGVETCIDIEATSLSTNTLDAIRLDLRAIKGSLATNDADAKAIATLTNGYTATEARQTINALRRELIDLINDVQALRRAQAQTVKEIKP